MAGSSETLTSQDDFRDVLLHKLKVVFKMIVFRKIKCDGYYDMAYYYRHRGYELLAELVRQGHINLAEEYKKYVLNDQEQTTSLTPNDVSNVLDNIMCDDDKDTQQELSQAEANAIIDILKKTLLGCFCQDKSYCEKLIGKIFNKAYCGTPNIKCDRALIYDADKVDVKRIHRVSDLLSEVNLIHKLSSKSSSDDLAKHTIFYRGQSDANHILLPSVMRTDKRYEKERAMYQQLMIECPDELAQCQTHLERLSKMQHYGLPTRLLDVTRNPLVALYFACEKPDGTDGEIVVLSQETVKIKDFDSDTVAVLASLPLFIRDEQKEIFRKVNRFINNVYCRDKMCGDSLGRCIHRHIGRKHPEKSGVKVFNDNYLIHRLVHEVRQEKPGFIDEIIPCHLVRNYFVQALKDTPRIIRQDGAFIICGLGKDVAKELHEFRYQCGCGKKKLLIVNRSSKKRIRRELESLSIHSRSLMPEIENVAPLIESSIKDQIMPSVR